MTLGATAARADFENITDIDAFVGLVDQATLTRFGTTVTVAPDGGISGRAFGSPVTGSWSWESGYFCRDLTWGGSDLGYNCQQVAQDGQTLRFTSDKGAGRSADLTID
jgi:hypothetical protein